MQAYGAEGLCQDTPLAQFWANLRTLRYADVRKFYYSLRSSDLNDASRPFRRARTRSTSSRSARSRPSARPTSRLASPPSTRRRRRSTRGPGSRPSSKLELARAGGQAEGIDLDDIYSTCMLRLKDEGIDRSLFLSRSRRCLSLGRLHSNSVEKCCELLGACAWRKTRGQPVGSRANDGESILMDK